MVGLPVQKAYPDVGLLHYLFFFLVLYSLKKMNSALKNWVFYTFSSAKLWDNMMNCELHVNGNRSLHVDNSYDTPASVWWEGET